ncbi:RNI-like protein [Piromyces finnis]|uniref:RNI-like protein n=1 Tax=Piromyces finnis TaxID=1754191 RepID=A0A1Y1VEN1_9FUNG|nr:RNI-like protein [Piromyces finnis]|eukprot:ORX54304.1 RNI-like protein [Piromyces finnis]
MENKDDTFISNNENNNNNIQSSLQVVINNNENMKINEQSDNSIIQLNLNKMNLNSPQSPSSINPAIDSSDIYSDVDANGSIVPNFDDTDNIISDDDNEESNPKSNFILYKKIESNNKDPIQNLKFHKPSKSILKVTNVQPQKNNLFKKDWFKEKFGTSGNTISSAFKSFSNNANMVIERQFTSLTNGQGTWKSKSNDSIYLNNYYNDAIGNTTAIDETTRINPEQEKKDICDSMDLFLHDIPKRVRFSFEDISTALANDENRLSYYQVQLQKIQEQQEKLRNRPISVAQRKDSLNHGHSIKNINPTPTSPGPIPSTPTTPTNIDPSQNNNNNSEGNIISETQNNVNLNTITNETPITEDTNLNYLLNDQTNPSNEVKDNKSDENLVEVEGIKEGDIVNLDELYDEEKEEEEEEEIEKPLTNPKEKYPLTPIQILKAYEIEWKRRNEKPIIPIISMLRKKINDGERIVPVIDIHDVSITKSSVISLSDLLAIRFGLETLNLENTGIVNDEMKVILNSLLQIKTLRHLNIANNSKSSEGVKYISSFIRKHKKLCSLNISKLFFNWELISYLSIALESDTSLKLLIMDGCQVNYHDFLKMFAKGVHKSNLKYLSLKNNKFNSDCGEMLAHLINPSIPLFKKQDMTSLNGLTYINLSNSKLKPCFFSFSKGLINNPYLKHLIIRNNNLEAPELAILSEILIQNDVLQTIDISKNKKLCSELDQIIQLKNALIANKTLMELNMAQTGLNSEGAITIAEIFPLNKALRVLNLRLNPIDIAGVVALSVSLKLNNTITSLQLSQFVIQNEIDNEIEPEFQRILSDILISCSRNMTLNPYIETADTNEFKEFDINQCTSPIEPNDNFYQKLLNTPKKLMKRSSSSTISSALPSSNRNSLNSNTHSQNRISNNNRSGSLAPPIYQFQDSTDNHSNSSMDNNIDMGEDEQLKHDTELAIKLSKKEEEERKLIEKTESLENNIKLLEQMINSDDSEKETQNIVLSECEKDCKELVERIVDESIKNEVLSNQILALNDRYTIIIEKLKQKRLNKEDSLISIFH